MPRTLVVLALLAAAGAPLAAAAGGNYDPHGRARQWIAPPPLSLAPLPAAATATEPSEAADAHAQLRQSIRAERRPSMLPPVGFTGEGSGEFPDAYDAHRRVREIILGRDS